MAADIVQSTNFRPKERKISAEFRISAIYHRFLPISWLKPRRFHTSIMLDPHWFYV